MQLEDSAHRSRAPSLTPLIDVVFILLVFFMLVSSFVEWRTVAVDTPPPVSMGAAEEASEALRLQVFPAGRLVLDGEAATLDAVESHVRSLPAPTVAVMPMDGLKLQGLVTVLDRLAAAGAEISLREP
jgi:biopolymer transport protein ExbD